MKNINLTELVKEIIKESKEVDSFVNTISRAFRKDILKDHNTTEMDGVIISNDSIFYSLIGKYIKKTPKFAKWYDALPKNEQSNIDDEIGDTLADKLNIEF